jgi:hypothetical protein
MAHDRLQVGVIADRMGADDAPRRPRVCGDDVQLAAGRGVELDAERGQVVEQLRRAVGLDRVERDHPRQVLPPEGDLARDAIEVEQQQRRATR